MASKAEKEFLIRVKADIQAAVKDMQRLTGTLKDQAKVAGKGIPDPTPKMREGMKKTQSLAGDLKRELAGVFSLAAIGSAVKQSINAVREYQNSFLGLEAVANHAGIGIKAAWEQATKLSADGLMSVAEAAKSLQNLLSRGYSLDEAVQTIQRLKDAAAFNRQASLEMGEAVVTATEGLKNENSVLVDNAGVTKNVSVLWKEYAERTGKTVESLTQQEKVQAEVNGILRETEAQVGNAAKAAAGAEGKMAAFRKSSNDLAVALGDSLLPAVTQLFEWGQKLTNEWIRPFIGKLKGLGAYVGALSLSLTQMISGDFDHIGENFNRAKEMMKEYRKAAEKGIVSITRNIKDNVDQQKQAEQDAAHAADDRRRAAAEELKILDKRLALMKANVEADARLTQDAVQRRLRALDDEREQNLIGYREYYQRRKVLQEQAIDAEIRKTRQALNTQRKGLDLAKTDKDRLPILTTIKKLETDLVVLERQRADAGTAAAREQNKADKAFAKELSGLRARLLEAQGKGAQAQIVRLENEFRETIKRFQAVGDQEGVILVQKLFNTEVARAQFDQMAAEYARARQSMAQKEQRIQVELDSGLITQTEAQRRIVTLHQDTAAELEKQIPLMEKLAGTLGPEAQSQVRQFGVEIQRLNVPVNAAAAEIENNLQGAFEKTFEDIASGATDARGAIEDMGRAILDIVRNRLAEQLADQMTKFLFNPTAGASGGGGGLLYGLFSSIGLFHSGGIVGQTAPDKRMVSPLAFAQDPRFHTGGLVPGEVPIIAQVGEEILSRNDPRNSRNGGAAGGSNGVRIVNVIDPALVQDYMTSSAGEDTILNVLSRRRSDVQSIVR